MQNYAQVLRDDPEYIDGEDLRLNDTGVHLAKKNKEAIEQGNTLAPGFDASKIPKYARHALAQTDDYETHNPDLTIDHVRGYNDFIVNHNNQKMAQKSYEVQKQAYEEYLRKNRAEKQDRKRRGLKAHHTLGFAKWLQSVGETISNLKPPTIPLNDGGTFDINPFAGSNAAAPAVGGFVKGLGNQIDNLSKQWEEDSTFDEYVNTIYQGIGDAALLTGQFANPAVGIAMGMMWDNTMNARHDADTGSGTFWGNEGENLSQTWEGIKDMVGV